MQPTRLTITTDASYYVESKAAAYAIWISSDYGYIKAAACFKQTIDCIFEAEFKAILNALHITTSRLDTSRLEWVIINTDNMDCVRAINGHLRLHNRFSPLATVLLNYKKQLPKQCTVKARHVKAHRGTDTPRQFVNDWCDKNAKKHARKQHNAHCNRKAHH